MVKKRKRKIKKSVVFCLILIFVFIVGIGAFALFGGDKKSNNSLKNNNKNVLKFNEYMITVADIDLYSKSDNGIINFGKVSTSVLLHLEKYNNTYYKVLDLDNDYFVKKEKLDVYNDDVIIDDRYKNYIVFNENVVTSDNTKFYDEDDKLVYTINESVSLPIIVKDDDKYGVEFAERLLYIKKDDCNVTYNHNTDLHNISGIAALNYHAFYDENNEQEKSECNTAICHSKKQFRDQLDLIKEMNILTLKMKEVEMYVDGKIQLPKSVILTIDDGGRTQVAIDLLTEYKMYGTIFLVTSWYDPKDYYKTDYIELHSHSHNMHNTGDCPKGQGGGIQCLSEEKIQDDLKTARDLLNQTTYFCYPFYEFNDYSIKMLKEAGFTMAFAGESSRSDNLIKVGGDKFRLPRFVIVDYTTLNDLKKYFNQMK